MVSFVEKTKEDNVSRLVDLGSLAGGVGGYLRIKVICPDCCLLFSNEGPLECLDFPR